MKQFIIKPSLPQDKPTISAIHKMAFNAQGEGDIIANLVMELFDDETAKPYLSLLAWQNNQAIGHILFTQAYWKNNGNSTSLALLAPLAVIPDYQKQGIGTLLVKEGLQNLQQQNYDLIFVFGNPQYYQRFGFKTALDFEIFAPFPLPEKYKSAWMVLAFKENILAKNSGQIECAKSINKKEYWL